MKKITLCAAVQRINDRNIYRSRLINTVRSNPILWDKKSPAFNQRLVKIQKWMEVAEQLGVSYDKIRRTWENLRDQYRRDLKRSITMGARSKWRFFNDMNFLRAMVRIKGSKYQRQSDSESDYEEFINDNNQEAPSAANLLENSCQATTSTTATATTINKDNAFDEFLPIQLNTEWKQRTALEELQQTQQREQEELKQQPPSEEKKCEEQPQQDCDSSEEQKYDDEVHVVELSNLSNVMKIEIDSDSIDESLPETLQQQQQHLNQQQQLQPQEPPREPRPCAPRPDINEQESEEFVSTSDSAIKSRKRRLSTQADATAEDHYQNCLGPKLVPQDSELQDEDYHFVMSILPSLRQVARQRKFPLRSQIMTLISKELEESND